MSKKVEVPTTAAILRPFRSSTLVSPASLRATMAPSTAVATPVTLSGTPSSKALAAEQVLLVDDLGAGPAELEVGQADLALGLGAQDGGRAGHRGGRARAGQLQQ